MTIDKFNRTKFSHYKMSDIDPRITNIGNKDDYDFFVFNTDDVLLANMLDRSIRSEVETYAIKYVSFDVNKSARHDEILSLRFGQCPISNDKLDIDNPEKLIVEFDVSGPKEFTTHDIPEIPFAQKVPIITLRNGERIAGRLFIEKGKGKDHVKWRPVGCLGVTSVDGGFMFKFKNKGHISNEEIIRRGLDGMLAAATREPLTIFSRPVVPSSLLLPN